MDSTPLAKLLFGLTLGAAVGCARVHPAPDRFAAARAAFEQSVARHHLPSAGMNGAARDEQLRLAAKGYRQLVREYPEQSFWCAQAMRSLANIAAAQGDVDAAVRLYERVGAEYPREDFEVLQAWKSAADLLWDAGQTDRAAVFYRQIINRCGAEASSGIARVIASAATRRLAQPEN
jgi:tetratricopeptide (TPR) repeat protein